MFHTMDVIIPSDGEDGILDGMTIADSLEAAIQQFGDAGIETPRLEAQVLLAWVLSCRREDLARTPEQAITDEVAGAFMNAVTRRAGREPLPYITGERWFFGRRFRVTDAVLIPRPETEMLVSLALETIAGTQSPTVLEAGVGSGCISVTLAAERADLRAFGTDISPAALAVARENAESNAVQDRCEFIAGDLLTPYMDPARKTYADLVVANPPYVSLSDMNALQPEVRDYEPRVALVGSSTSAAETVTGADGVGLYREIFEQANQVLKPGSSVLVEIGMGQCDAVIGIARAAGLVDVASHLDMSGIPRVVSGKKGYN